MPNIAKEFIKNIIKRITKKHYSQAGQDFWVSCEAFNQKRDGFFLEIGAADGLTFSNTYFLEKKLNWTGICIEANPFYLNKLRTNRICTIVEACLDNEIHEIEFKSAGLYGGIVDEDTDNLKKEDNSETVLMMTQILTEILIRYQAPKIIDYMSIDVEGAEYRILKNFPFDSYCFLTITIERPSEDLVSLLEFHNYKIVKIIPGLDTFFIHESFVDEYMCNSINYWSRLASSFQ